MLAQVNGKAPAEPLQGRLGANFGVVASLKRDRHVLGKEFEEQIRALGGLVGGLVVMCDLGMFF